jgi:predicted ATPase
MAQQQAAAALHFCGHAAHQQQQQQLTPLQRAAQVGCTAGLYCWPMGGHGCGSTAQL